MAEATNYLGSALVGPTGSTSAASKGGSDGFGRKSPAVMIDFYKTGVDVFSAKPSAMHPKQIIACGPLIVEKAKRQRRNERIVAAGRLNVYLPAL